MTLSVSVLHPTQERGRAPVRSRARARDLEPVDLGDDAPDAAVRLRRALAMLHDATSVADLVRRVPAAVVALGLDRVLYSHVTDHLWTPAAELSNAPVVDGRSRVIDLSLPEHLVVCEGRAVLVHGPEGSNGLVPAWRSRGYVAVPVVQRGVVVAIIHADCPLQRRLPGLLDRELLSAFAEGVSGALACARAVGALHTLRSRISLLTEEVDDGSAFGARRGDEVAEGPVGLTRREREVLELMSAGQTNGQIARRLVITEGTTKSHVKRILRKLHAANRAEAVATWMRAGTLRAAP
jgi:DNA-binding CsgD family transcriptional regulator